MQLKEYNKKEIMGNIVILGAGLTGLSAAYHLEKKGYNNFEIFEKEKTPGGLCRSIYQDGFTFDFTGHLLHTSDPYFRELIDSIVGFDQFNSIRRRAFVYSQDRYTPYPFQINLHGLPTKTITDCIVGFVGRNTSIKQPKSFTQWVLKHFGPGFARHFFFPYQKKIFAYDIRKLSASWTGRFVPSTSLEQIIQGTVHNNEHADIGYNAHFWYPKQGGIMSWVHTLAKHIKKPIHTNFCVKSIDIRNKQIMFENGHVTSFDYLINTIPLDTFLAYLQEKASTTLARARKHLLCNSVINFNLGITRPDLSDKHWIYFPEPKYPFYRIGFPHNFSQAAVPPGCSSLYGEFAHINKSSGWVRSTLAKSLTMTKKFLNISNNEIKTEKVIPISHAYVIYDTWRDKHVPKLLKRLEEHNMYSTGRYGAWKYASMQEAILDGKKVAEIITNKPYTVKQTILNKRREKQNNL